MSLQHMYEATIVFQEVTTGLFKIVKDKRTVDQKGSFCTIEKVADYLNRRDIKVSLLGERNAHLASNFEIERKEKANL